MLTEHKYQGTIFREKLGLYMYACPKTMSQK